MRIAGTLGMAGPALATLERAKGRGSGRRLGSSVRIEEVPRFSSEVDQLFHESASRFSLIGDRTSGSLNWWYPESNPTYRRLLIKDAGRAIGWALVLDTAMKDHKYFGDMRVGTLADCFAVPGNEQNVVAAADHYLSEHDVDLIVSNQLHGEWVAALEGCGYRHGPSNYFFYFSHDLADRLATIPNWQERIHLNRGDGDGPIHL
jgi:hypothetical protein